MHPPKTNPIHIASAPTSGIESNIGVEQSMRALLAHGSDVISLVDASGKVTYWSPSYAHVLGYSEKDLEKHQLFQTVHPEDLPAIKMLFAQLAAQPGATVKSQYRQKHHNGTYRWMDGWHRHQPAARPGYQGYRVHQPGYH